MTTIDQADRLVLDFYRCGMLPAGPDWQPDQAPHDDLATIGVDVPGPAAESDRASGTARCSGNKVPGPHFDRGLAGAVLHSTGDVVSSAPRAGPAHPEYCCHTS